MEFTKMQGCGNDYIYVDCFKEQVADPSKLAVRLSDRHYGIGGDGLILIEPSDCADAFMHMFNLDGSEGKMCGNGLRCVVKYVYDHHMIPEDRRSAMIDTRAGLRHADFEVADGLVSSVTVDMGIASITGELSEELCVEGIQIKFTGMDIGNPHAVVFMEENPVLANLCDGTSEDAFAALPLDRIGPCFEHSSRFPDGVNTEFIEIISRNEVRFRVWERGSGETLACGTGAAASVAAGCLRGILDDEVLVHLAGGDLRIKYDRETGRCLMTGPAEYVFTGTVDL